MRTLTAFGPSDIGELVSLHGGLYLKEWRYDRRFEYYVAKGLEKFLSRFDRRRDRLWLVKEKGRIVGSVAIAHRTRSSAQLRWLLVAPAFRGKGLGRELVRAALNFARSAGYRSVFLWTTSELDAARHLYERAGFRRTARRTHDVWGRRNITEERYILGLVRPSRPTRTCPASCHTVSRSARRRASAPGGRSSRR